MNVQVRSDVIPCPILADTVSERTNSVERNAVLGDEVSAASVQNRKSP